MADVIGALVVTLGLDASNFNAEQKKALETTNKAMAEMEARIKNLEARNKAAAYSFSDMTNAAEGLFTVLVGAGVAAFARDTINSAAAVGRMATNANVATKEMSAFGRMIERNGGDAAGAQANLVSLSQTLQNARWGEVSTSFLMGMSQVGGDINDSPLALFIKLAKFANDHSAQEVQQAGARIGLSMDIINEAIKGSNQALYDFGKASNLALSPDQVSKLTKAQEAWKSLSDTIYAVGTDVIAAIAPGFTAVSESVVDWTEKNRSLADSLLGIIVAVAGFASLKPAAWVLRLLGLGASVPISGAAIVIGAGVEEFSEARKNALETTADERNAEFIRQLEDAQNGTGAWAPPGSAPTPASAAARSDRSTPADRSAWIRGMAAMLGIDPDIALYVANAEGFKDFNSGIPGEKSYGDFQLHITPGGRGHAVGDEFKAQTGLDPSDPANEKMMDAFALKWVKQHGWENFHGAANSPQHIGNWQGIGAGGGDITIENLTINAETNDPKRLGRQTADAIRDRLNATQISTMANTGQRP